MKRLSIALAACLLGLLDIRSVLGAACTSPWGTPVNGLRGRLTALADTVHEGETLHFVLELEYRAPKKGAPQRFINWMYHAQAPTFHFREGTTGADVALQIGYGGLHWRDRESDLKPLGTAHLADTLRLWPMAGNRKPLPAGQYDLVAGYRPPGPEELGADLRTKYAGRLWEDSLQTGPVAITVLPALQVEKTIYTNGGICLEQRDATMLGGGVWQFTPGDSVAIRYVPRPGQRVGRKYVMSAVNPEGTQHVLATGYGGPVLGDEPLKLQAGSPDLPPDAFLRFRLIIYETAMPGGHLSRPESSDSTLYRELFSRTFDCRLDRTTVCPP